MPIVTPNWNLPTPALTDAYNLVGDLATFSSAVDGALTEVGNVFKGTASERIAFASIAVDGMLWQDTDGIKMIWRRDSTVAGNWTPAVTRWTGTTAQMNAFATSAPNGFEWFNSSDSNTYLRSGGSWVLFSGQVDGALTTISQAGTGSGLTVMDLLNPPPSEGFDTGNYIRSSSGFTVSKTGIYEVGWRANSNGTEPISMYLYVGSTESGLYRGAGAGAPGAATDIIFSGPIFLTSGQVVSVRRASTTSVSGSFFGIFHIRYLGSR